jgi:hypothetical protein
MKVAVSAGLIVLISEISKRSSLLGAVFASIPLVSVLAMIWLYIDTRDTEKVGELSIQVFWLVLPSLALFVILPLLLKRGMNFYLSLSLSIAATVVCYGIMLLILRRFGIRM